jgi:hypothetical protein
MFPAALVFALGGTLLVADGVPALNVEPGCRAAAKMGDSLSLDTSLRQCLADEKSARDELEKQWTQFSPPLRERCVATTETGGSPSYVEVSRVPADGARCGADGKVFGRRSAR